MSGTSAGLQSRAATTPSLLVPLTQVQQMALGGPAPQAARQRPHQALVVLLLRLLGHWQLGCSGVGMPLLICSVCWSYWCSISRRL